MDGRFLFRLVTRSLANRLGNWVIALVAVALGTALVSASLRLATGMRSKMSQTLRAYGANLVVVPGAAMRQPGGEELFAQLPEDVLVKLGSIAAGLPLLGYAPLLYVVATVDTQRVALVGTWPQALRQISPWWHVEGNWIGGPADGNEALVGASLAQKLGLNVGAAVTLTVDSRSRRFHVVGILSTGGSEDEQVVIHLPAAQALAGRAGQLSLVQVSAAAVDDSIERIGEALQAGLPGVEVRSQRRVVEAEERLLARVAWLLALVAVLVSVTASLGVAAAVITNVVQRTGEVALMKALGASRAQVGSLLLSEAGAVGLAGGVLGGVAGIGIARLIAWSAFGGSVPVAITPVLAAMVMGIIIASLASLIPVMRVAAVEPGIVLKGE